MTKTVRDSLAAFAQEMPPGESERGKLAWAVQQFSSS